MKFLMFIQTEIKKITFFLSFKLSDVVFIMLIIVKMPTIVGILTFMSMINLMLSWVEHGKSFITSGPDLQIKVECSGSVGRALDWGSKGCLLETRHQRSHYVESLSKTFYLLNYVMHLVTRPE